MSNSINSNVNRVLDSNGDPVSGAKLYAYDTGTTTPQTIYTDKALSTATAVPHVADSEGVFAAIYSANTTDLKIVVKDASDVTLYTLDPAVVHTIGGGASTIAFTPTSRIPDTNVQDAIETVDGYVAAIETPPGLIFGLTLSNGTDTDHDIVVATGQASSDDVTSSSIKNMNLSSAITKQIDAAWAVGSAAGGIDTGAVANSTWYHVFLIKRSDTGIVDVLFSTSATSPTMPTNYSLKRRVGSVLTDGSANIVAFIQTEDEILWDAAVTDVSAANPGTAQVTPVMSTPLGVKVVGIFNGQVYNTGVANAGALSSLSIRSLDHTDAPASASNTTHGNLENNIGDATSSTNQIRVRTDTSSQIGYILSESDAGISVTISTVGWVDTRGRLA